MHGPDLIDSGVDDPEQSGPDAVVDEVPRDAGADELGSGDNAVLAAAIAAIAS